MESLGVGLMRRLVVVIATGLVLLVVSCGSSASPGESGEIDREATLRLTFSSVSSLDPSVTAGSTAVLSNTWPVYDRLLQISEDGEYLPMLATKWTFTHQGKRLRVQLRSDVTFSDGTHFTSATVKANVDRYRESEVSAPTTEIISEVDVVDEHTVDLHLTRPSRDVLAGLAAAAPGIMISENALSNPDLGTNPVGSGAWVIDDFRPNESVSYTRRTDEGGIWDPETGQVARVEIAVRTPPAAYAALKSGQIDVALSNGDVSELQSAIDQGDLQVRPLPSASTIPAVYMNHTMKPFDDVRVRQAVNFAINRGPIVDAFVPTTTPRVQPMASVVNGFDETLEGRYPYDPAKARALLAKAGYPNGIDAGTFYVGNFEPLPSVAQIVQSDLAEVGIRIELEQFDMRQLATGAYAKSERPGAFMFMAFPSLEPGSALRWFYDNPLTMPGGVPDRIAAKIALVDDSTASQTQRAARARAVVKWAMGQALYAPMYQGVPGLVISDHLHGMEEGKAFLAPLGGQDMRHAWIAH